MEVSIQQERTRVILKDLQFPMHRTGYWQLCEAIPLFARSPGLSMTKELYPLLAKRFARDVESSIRRAILYAWEHGNREAWDRYFPGLTKAPSNLVFISTIAEHIK